MNKRKFYSYFWALRICFCPTILWRDIKLKYYEFQTIRSKIETLMIEREKQRWDC